MSRRVEFVFHGCLDKAGNSAKGRWSPNSWKMSAAKEGEAAKRNLKRWKYRNALMLWNTRCSQGYQSLVMIIITLDAELLCNRYCISIAINDKVAMRLWDKKILFGYCQLQMVNTCGVFGEALEYCFMISQVERREKEHLEGLINFKFNLTYPQYYGILTIVQNSDEVWSD